MSRKKRVILPYECIMYLSTEGDIFKGAIYKVGNSALVNTEVFEEYLEQFQEPARPLAVHIWKNNKETPKTGGK